MTISYKIKSTFSDRQISSLNVLCPLVDFGVREFEDRKRAFDRHL